MLSAWQDLGSRTSRDHLIHALSNSTKRSGAKAVPQGWLGKQRRYQEDAVYVSFPLPLSSRADEIGSFLITKSACMHFSAVIALSEVHARV